MGNCCKQSTETQSTLETAVSDAFDTDYPITREILQKLISTQNRDTFDIIRLGAYDYLNRFRFKPENFMSEGLEKNINITNVKKGNFIEFTDEAYLEIKDYLNKPNDNNKSFTIIEEEIARILRAKDGIIRKYQTITDKNDYKGIIWNLLQQNIEDIDEILSGEYSNVMIICEELSLGRQIVTHFIFYNK